MMHFDCGEGTIFELLFVFFCCDRDVQKIVFDLIKIV